MIYISERYNSYMKATSKLSASRPTAATIIEINSDPSNFPDD